MDRVNSIISDVIGSMITPPVEDQNNICALKKSTIQFLIINKKLTCPIQIQQIEQIDNQTDLEMFLQQLALSTEDILNIYRGSYGTI